ncbi:MAG: hypothetical protein GY756_04025 [bacterium]|nr:hypothetical protein [bacterium]
MKESIEEMAKTYVKSIKSIQENGPYLIGGHSFGGYIAFEIARQMELEGEAVETVFIFDSVEPGYIKCDDFNEELMVSKIFDYFDKLHNIEIQYDMSKIISLREDDRWIFLHDLLKKYNISFSIDMIKGKYNVIKSASTNMVHYNPRSKLKDINIILCKAKDNIQRFQDKDQNQVIDNSLNEVDYGWSKHAVKDIQTYEITGDHNSLLNYPNVEEIADVIMNLVMKKELVY